MRKALQASSYVAMALMVFAVIYVLKVVTPMYRVETGSMEPTLPTKSIVLIHQQSEYQPGDVITFRADEGKIVTHRLVEIDADGSFITKGDANPTPDNFDDPVTQRDVKGKVIYMTPIFTLAFWGTLRGIAIMILVALITLALMWRVDDEDDQSQVRTQPVEA